MGIKETIEQDFQKALQEKDALLLSVLRMLRAAIKNRQLEKRAKLSKTEAIEKLEDLSQLNEEEIIEVIKSEVKKRKEAIEQYQKGERPDLVKQEEHELRLLTGYLPEQMTEEQIVQKVKEAIAQLKAAGPREMGKVMSQLMPRLKNQADGALVKKIVEEELKKLEKDDHDSRD